MDSYLLKAGDIRSMKYRPGDRIKIKTWNALLGEFGLNKNNNDIRLPSLRHESYSFTRQREKWIQRTSVRIFTIKLINDFFQQYLIIEDRDMWGWSDCIVEYIVDENNERCYPIYSRLEILDL